jgi:16S rRNA (cytosine1402-N4)-methyltransferase
LTYHFESNMDSFSGHESYPHLPVLYHEIILALHPSSLGRYVDATVGGGGHAWGILDACNPIGQLLGIDLDPQALSMAEQRLAFFGDRVRLVQASYTSLSDQLSRIGWDYVQGIIFDLGVSSMQFDTPQRGFSFQYDGALDMRFNPDQSTKATDLVNNLPEHELASLLWRYGEEKQSRRIAQAICQARPLHTTRQLAEIILQVSPKHGRRLHPATRSFQALRIAVNQELTAISSALPQAVDALAAGGRLAVISFHSLEDRLVKQYFRQESRDCICPPKQPVCTCQHRSRLEEVNRHGITPSASEIEQNPRSRSARLRIVQKKLA